jgi:Ca2+-binding RTX toxin-like protein
LGGSGSDTITGGIDVDLIEGGEGADSLLGGDGDDIIEGDGIDLAGNDTLNGGIGNDFLNGGGAVDRILGGAGSDTLYGGDDLPEQIQRDTLTGNAGSDYFRLEDSGLSGQLGDYISDFQDGIDFLQTGFSFEALTISRINLNIGGVSTGSTRITVTATGEELAVVAGLLPGRFTAVDFVAL